jgi:hypothetical protein
MDLPDYFSFLEFRNFLFGLSRHSFKHRVFGTDCNSHRLGAYLARHAGAMRPRFFQAPPLRE